MHGGTDGRRAPRMGVSGAGGAGRIHSTGAAEVYRQAVALFCISKSVVDLGWGHTLHPFFGWQGIPRAGSDSFEYKNAPNGSFRCNFSALTVSVSQCSNGESVG